MRLSISKFCIVFYSVPIDRFSKISCILFFFFFKYKMKYLEATKLLTRWLHDHWNSFSRFHFGATLSGTIFINYLVLVKRTLG